MMISSVGKRSGFVLLAAAFLAATFALGQAQEKKSNAPQDYLVVRMPFNIIEREFNTQGNERKPGTRPIHPMNELSAEGWDFVQAVYVQGGSFKGVSGEGYGGDFVCFFRRRPLSTSVKSSTPTER